MDPKRRKSFGILIVLLIGLGAVPLIWPGDAPWINDEPKLIQMAMHAKATGEMAIHGLPGSRGVLYGPFPTWIYTALLYMTNDLIDLVFIRAFLVTALTAAAIAWLALLCPSLRPPAGVIALLSPYLWIYSRQLWDNSFLIPLSALTVACYISFGARPAAWKLWGVVLAAAAMFLTHFMSAALVVPLILHALIAHRRRLGDHRMHVVLSLVAAVVVSSPYIAYLASVESVARSTQPEFSIWRGWVFPLLGGQFFSSYGIEYFFGENWRSGYLQSAQWVIVAGWITWIALPFTWMGMAVAARRVWTGLREGGIRNTDFHMSFLSLSVLLCQCLLDGVMKAYGHPHYFNATWFCFLYFLWSFLSVRASDDEGVGPAPPLLSGGYILSLASVLGFLILNVHHSGGNQNIHYGPTLKNQIAVVRQVQSYRIDSPVYLAVDNFRRFPHALQVIEQFHGWPAPVRNADTLPSNPLLIIPQYPAYSMGWVILEERDNP